MNCSSCKNEIQPGMKFCTNCGTPTAVAGHETAAAQTAAASQSKGGTEQFSAYAEKGKQLWNNYLPYAKMSLKNPARVSETISSQQLKNSLINIILMGLFLAFNIYLNARNALDAMSNPFIDTSDLEIPLGSFLFKPFFYFLIVMAVLAGVLFVGTKLMQSTQTFTDVLARFGSYVFVPAVLMALSLIVNIISDGFITYVLLSFSIFSVYVSMALTLFSFKTNKGLDVFYSVILSYALASIILGILLAEKISSFLEELPF